MVVAIDPTGPSGNDVTVRGDGTAAILNSKSWNKVTETVRGTGVAPNELLPSTTNSAGAGGSSGGSAGGGSGGGGGGGPQGLPQIGSGVYTVTGQDGGGGGLGLGLGVGALALAGAALLMGVSG